MRILRVAGVLLGVALMAALSLASNATDNVQQKVRTYQQQALADWRAAAPLVAADVERWRYDPLIAPRDGTDAAALLGQRLRWDGDGKAAVFTPEMLAQLKSADGGWVHAGGRDLEGIEVSWMHELGRFAYWELQPPGEAPFRAFSEPLPDFADLQLFAKLHLARGLTAGDARASARDVRELARLCFTTEQLVGEMIGVALLNFERRAYDEAVRRGHDVGGWAPVSEADSESLKRLLWAAPAPHGLLATGELAEADISVGYCAGLQEGATSAHYLRGFAQPELPERYVAIERSLFEPRCRLTRVRRAWRSGEGQLPVSGEAFCVGKAKDEKCNVPGFVVWLPFVRSFVGKTLVVIATPDWLRRYRPDAGQ